MECTELREVADRLLLPMNEGRVSKKDFLKELRPLIDEYFIGDAKANGESIIFRLRNGQAFKIIALNYRGKF